jgi:hypothetical protein
LILSELWTPNDADVVLINKGAPFDEVRESARHTTLSMADDVTEKLSQGRTNLEELIRALPHSALRQLPHRVGLGACRPRSAARRQRATNLVDDRGVARA